MDTYNIWFSWESFEWEPTTQEVQRMLDDVFHTAVKQQEDVSSTASKMHEHIKTLSMIDWYQKNTEFWAAVFDKLLHTYSIQWWAIEYFLDEIVIRTYIELPELLDEWSSGDIFQNNHVQWLLYSAKSVYQILTTGTWGRRQQSLMVSCLQWAQASDSAYEILVEVFRFLGATYREHSWTHSIYSSQNDSSWYILTPEAFAWLWMEMRSHKDYHMEIMELHQEVIPEDVLHFYDRWSGRL